MIWLIFLLVMFLVTITLEQNGNETVGEENKYFLFEEFIDKN